MGWGVGGGIMCTCVCPPPPPPPAIHQWLFYIELAPSPRDLLGGGGGGGGGGRANIHRHGRRLPQARGDSVELELSYAVKIWRLK